MERAAERVAWAARQARDLVSFWDQCREALAASVPHYLTPCWFTFDPMLLLITSHYDHGMIATPELDPAWLAAHPVRSAARAGGAGDRSELSSDDEGEMRKFLRGLGYVE